MGLEPGNPIVGGTVLRIPAIQSTNFVAGSEGWTLNQDGTAQFNELTIVVQSTGAAILIYLGQAGAGALIGSWANTAGTDSYGNSYPAGLYVAQGVITGTTLSNSSVVGALVTSGAISGSTIGSSQISGGTITESVITFDSNGGALLLYETTTTTTTYNTAGSYQFTASATGSAKVECWGADAGAGGGSSSKGGEGGGGGEYACETSYPLVDGQVYNVVVGAAGTGGQTNHAGNAGGDTSFDGTGVYANGGSAGASYIGGAGGTGSTNTIHHNGGNGGGTGSQSTGGCGGGGRAGSTGAGGNGATSASSTGAAGGSAGTGTGGIAGGAGGNSTANGNNGGGGGGCGAASGTSQLQKTYGASNSYAYYGLDTGGSQRNHNGSIYQGNPDVSPGSYPGNQFSFVQYSGGTIESDFSGYSISQVSINITNQHSWYDSGCSIDLGYSNRTSFPATLSSFGSGDHDQQSGGYSISEGANKTFDISSWAKSVVGTSSFECIMFGPAPGSQPNLSYYGYFAYAPTITVTGSKGSGTATAGSGSDGQVSVTYTSGTTLVGSISPVAGTDQYSNSYPAGLATAQGVTLTDQSAPSTPSGAAVLYGAGGQAYALGADGGAYALANVSYLTSDATQCSSTTQSGTGLTVPLLNGGTYFFEARVILANQSTNQIYISMGGTAHASAFGAWITYEQLHGTSYANEQSLHLTVFQGTLGTNTGLGNTSSPSNGTQYVVHLQGAITCSQTGTLTVNQAAGANSASYTVKVLSCLKVWPVP